MKEWQALSQMERLQPKEHPLPPPLPGQVAMPKPNASPTSSGHKPRTFCGKAVDVVDVNNASTDDLLTLPCMTVERVRMIEAYRREHETLATVEDVGRICSLKPHEVEKLRSRVSFSLAGNQRTESSAGKRVVDF
jgi:DNA uptake protein ComE-like DNA-binding protein